jgi:putative two-component system response regulator
LIVDDEPTNVTLLVRTMKWAGYSLIETASDGIEGLRRCDVFDPDIVILDLHMPNMDGYEVIAELRRRATGAFLPVLVYTADVT